MLCLISCLSETIQIVTLYIAISLLAHSHRKLSDPVLPNICIMPNCKKCNEDITAVPDSVNCAYPSCNNSFHMKCVGLSRTLLNFITNSPNVHFTCDDCTNGVFVLARKQTPTVPDSMATDLADIKKSLEILSSTMSTASSWPIQDKLGSKSKRSRYELDTDGNTTPIPLVKSKLATTAADKEVVVGSADANGLQIVEQRKLIVASMLHPSTEPEMLMEFLTTKLELPTNSSSIRVSKLLPAGVDPNTLDFISFKISVPTSMYEPIMKTAIWPKGVTVREFQNRPKKLRTGNFLPNLRRDLMDTNRPTSSPQTR